MLRQSFRSIIIIPSHLSINGYCHYDTLFRRLSNININKINSNNNNLIQSFRYISLSSLADAFSELGSKTNAPRRQTEGGNNNYNNNNDHYNLIEFSSSLFQKIKQYDEEKLYFIFDQKDRSWSFNELVTILIEIWLRARTANAVDYYYNNINSNNNNNNKLNSNNHRINQILYLFSDNMLRTALKTSIKMNWIEIEENIIDYFENEKNKPLLLLLEERQEELAHLAAEYLLENDNHNNNNKNNDLLENKKQIIREIILQQENPFTYCIKTTSSNNNNTDDHDNTKTEKEENKKRIKINMRQFIYELSFTVEKWLMQSLSSDETELINNNNSNLNNSLTKYVNLLHLYLQQKLFWRDSILNTLTDNIILLQQQHNNNNNNNLNNNNKLGLESFSILLDAMVRYEIILKSGARQTSFIHKKHLPHNNNNNNNINNNNKVEGEKEEVVTTWPSFHNNNNNNNINMSNLEKWYIKNSEHYQNFLTEETFRFFSEALIKLLIQLKQQNNNNNNISGSSFFFLTRSLATLKYFYSPSLVQHLMDPFIISQLLFTSSSHHHHHHNNNNNRFYYGVVLLVGRKENKSGNVILFLVLLENIKSILLSRRSNTISSWGLQDNNNNNNSVEINNTTNEKENGSNNNINNNELEEWLSLSLEGEGEEEEVIIEEERENIKNNKNKINNNNKLGSVIDIAHLPLFLRCLSHFYEVTLNEVKQNNKNNNNNNNNENSKLTAKEVIQHYQQQQNNNNNYNNKSIIITKEFLQKEFYSFYRLLLDDVSENNIISIDDLTLYYSFSLVEQLLKTMIEVQKLFPPTLFNHNNNNNNNQISSFFLEVTLAWARTIRWRPVNTFTPSQCRDVQLLLNELLSLGVLEVVLLRRKKKEHNHHHHNNNNLIQKYIISDVWLQQAPRVKAGIDKEKENILKSQKEKNTNNRIKSIKDIPTWKVFSRFSSVVNYCLHHSHQK